MTRRKKVQPTVELESRIRRRFYEELPKHPFPQTAVEIVDMEFGSEPGAGVVIEELINEL